MSKLKLDVAKVSRDNEKPVYISDDGKSNKAFECLDSMLAEANKHKKEIEQNVLISYGIGLSDTSDWNDFIKQLDAVKYYDSLEEAESEYEKLKKENPEDFYVELFEFIISDIDFKKRLKCFVGTGDNLLNISEVKYENNKRIF